MMFEKMFRVGSYKLRNYSINVKPLTTVMVCGCTQFHFRSISFGNVRICLKECTKRKSTSGRNKVSKQKLAQWRESCTCPPLLELHCQTDSIHHRLKVMLENERTLRTYAP